MEEWRVAPQKNMNEKRGFSLNIQIQNGGFSKVMKHGGFKGNDR